MADKIYTGRDLAQRDGWTTHAEWITQLCRRMAHLLETPFSGKVSGEPIYAYVDFGRWIAACECGGHEYVDPDEQIFYCFSCGNRAVQGDARPVIFPDARDEIERLLLRRPIDDRAGINALDRALKAKPLIPGLSRSWLPHETPAELRRQNREIKRQRG